MDHQLFLLCLCSEAFSLAVVRCIKAKHLQEKNIKGPKINVLFQISSEPAKECPSLTNV